jgi:hypothetical protein
MVFEAGRSEFGSAQRLSLSGFGDISNFDQVAALFDRAGRRSLAPRAGSRFAEPVRIHDSHWTLPKPDGASGSCADLKARVNEVSLSPEFVLFFANTDSTVDTIAFRKVSRPRVR